MLNIIIYDIIVVMTENEKLQALVRRCSEDLPFFTTNFLKIVPKIGGTIPFVLNPVQKLVHEKIEEQKRTTGRVRVIILKARQQGFSTYFAARFFHHVIFNRGVKAYLLAHQAKSTSNLYSMVYRYYSNLPEFLQPELGKCNELELTFKQLDSGYSLGTAGSKEQGRGETIQYLHSSETAFYEHPEIAAGLFQSMADSPGSEMIFESTANGMGNLFHSIWMAAKRGDNEYMPIFIPWFAAKEYSLDPPSDFVLDDEEQSIKEHNDLSLSQMYWRRRKILEFESVGFSEGVRKFRQEYPATEQEAFEGNIEESFISSEIVAKARRTKIENPSGAKIIGIDVARAGSARSAITIRQGRKVLSTVGLKIPDTMALVAHIVEIINTEKPDKVFIDSGGVGGGVYDRLKELGFKKIVIGIDFGSGSVYPSRYKNKRTEMWCMAKEWLEDGEVEIPDNDELHSDLTIPKCKVNSNSQRQLESKDDIRRRGFSSPDLGDSFVLTFAMPVAGQWARKENNKNLLNIFDQNQTNNTGWMTS